MPAAAIYVIFLNFHLHGSSIVMLQQYKVLHCSHRVIIIYSLYPSSSALSNKSQLRLLLSFNPGHPATVIASRSVDSLLHETSFRGRGILRAELSLHRVPEWSCIGFLQSTATRTSIEKKRVPQPVLKGLLSCLASSRLRKVLKLCKGQVKRSWSDHTTVCDMQIFGPHRALLNALLPWFNLCVVWVKTASFLFSLVFAIYVLDSSTVARFMKWLAEFHGAWVEEECKKRPKGRG